MAELILKKYFRLPLYWMGILIADGLLGWFVYRCFIGCRETEMLYFKVTFDTPWIPGVVISIALVVGVSLMIFRYSSVSGVFKALCPAWLLAALFLVPLNICYIAATVIIAAWCIFRLLLLLPFPGFLYCRDKYRISLIVLAVLALISFIYNFWLYDKAWRNQYLFFSDWGLFIEPALNCFRDKLMYEYFEHPGDSFVSHHFMPGFFVWFAPLIWFVRYPQTAMVVFGLFLSGSALLIYYFARLRKLPPVMAAICGLVYLLYPMVTNYNLSLFYGFHVITMFIPVFILFCCFYEKKNWTAAFLIFLLSLTIKETVGAFWVGWGICQFLSGHRRRGLTYAIIGGCYLLLCMKFIIPAFAESGEYMYVGHYGKLGNSIPEILLSPFTRPAVFWGQIFVAKKFQMLLLFCLPLLPALFGRPLWMGCCAISMSFLLMRDTIDLINMYLHHTTEMTVLFCCAFIAAVSAAWRTKKDANPWNKFLCLGLPPVRGKSLAAALLLSGLFSAGCGYWFIAQTPFTRNSRNMTLMLQQPDRAPVRRQVLELVPKGERLGTDERCGSLMLCSDLIITAARYHQCNYYFYDLYDKAMGVGHGFHRQMLEDPEMSLIWMYLSGRNNYYLFRRGGTSPYPYPFTARSEQEWQESDMPVALPGQQDLFELRVAPSREENGRLSVYFSVRVKAELSDFYSIEAYVTYDDDRVMYYFIPLGYGITLPEKIKPGEVFQFQVALPPDCSMLLGAGCKIEKIPGSSLPPESSRVTSAQ